jgi:branched-chain amino acid aminotransferase
VIGEGKPGPVTKQILKAFKELIKNDGEKIYPEE